MPLGAPTIDGHGHRDVGLELNIRFYWDLQCNASIECYAGHTLNLPM